MKYRLEPAMLSSVVPADGRLVAVQHGVVQVFHVQGDAVTHDDHQDHAAQAGHRQADRVAAQFQRLAVAVAQHALEAEPGRWSGRVGSGRSAAGRPRPATACVAGAGSAARLFASASSR